jgi:hypothetical protein
MREGVEIARFYIRNTGSEFSVERKDLFIDRILNGRLKITCMVNNISAIRKTFEKSDSTAQKEYSPFMKFNPFHMAMIAI